MMLSLTTLEYDLFLGLTFALVAVKGALIAFLSKKAHDKIKETGKFTFGFVFGVLFLVICLVISRVIYMYFDFVLTNFDPSTYYLFPNVFYWKLATLVATIGYAVFIYVTDLRVFKFKFKGIFAYLIGVLAVILFVYPVNQKSDFDFISTFALVADIIAVIIPIFFIYMGRKRSPYQVPSMLIAIGVIIYAIGANITTESLIVALVSIFGDTARITVYLISLILKMAGLIMFAYGVSNFAVKFSGGAPITSIPSNRESSQLKLPRSSTQPAINASS
nr:hypothetical protein [Candidatus Sigynarchaeota archaeon]